MLALAELKTSLTRPADGSYAPYGQVASDDGDSFAVVVMQYVRMLLKHKWLIISVIVIVCAVGTVKTVLTTWLYSAVTRIQIDREPTQVVEGGVKAPSDAGGDFLRTQYELLRSRSLAERVVSSLQLAEDKEFFAPRDKSLTRFLRDLVRPAQENQASPAELEAWATGIVGGNITVRPVPGSRLVDIIYTDSSPVRAQRIVNAYADAFVAASLDKRFEANAYARVFLEDQVKQLRIRMHEAEKALIDFAEEEKVIDVSNKTPITEENLATANAALGVIVSERMKHEQSWQQIQNASNINLPQFVTNAVIDGLRARRNGLVIEYEEKLETFKPSYPAMVQISNKIKEVDRQLAAEIKTIKATSKAAYEASLAQEEDMRKRMEQLRAEVLDSQKKGIRHNTFKREAELNRTLYNNLLQRLKEVDVASGVGTNNVFIVDRALVPGAPSEPNLLRAIMMSFIVGSGGGLGLAFLLEKLNDRIHLPDEAEQLSGLPTLGIIPTVPEGESFQEHLHDPHSAVSEAYRSLATALQFSSSSGIPRSIVITSSGPSEGKSSTAVAIARHFAMTGQKVLLVDADLRKPSLHEHFGMENTRGLSNYLVGAAEPPEVLHATQHPNLAFMASGPLPPNAADLLSGTRMFSLISIGSEVFDLVVIDSPPLLGLADAQLLASAASATMFVIASGRQRRGMVKSSLRRLQLTRCQLVGTVLTNFDARSTGYGYGYGYGYGDGYGVKNRSQAKLAMRAEALVEN